MNEFEKQEEIFKHDKFKLRLDLYQLENVINSNKKGIIAVTFSYLGGKTFFAKMIKSLLDIKREYNVKYVNLCQNDYEDTLITQMSKLIKENNHNSKEKEIIGIIFKYFWKVVSCSTFHKFNFDANKFFKKDNKINIGKLKGELTVVASNQKIVFLIDDIDKCKKKVLQNIKYFYDIDNVLFILFLDNRQLCDSSSLKTDNNINILPKELTCKFTENFILTDKYKDFSDFFNNICHAISEYNQINCSFSYDDIKIVVNHFHLNLAEIKKIMLKEFCKFGVQRKAFANQIQSNHGFFNDLIFLIYAIKSRDINAFQAIKSGDNSSIESFIEKHKNTLKSYYIEYTRNYINMTNTKDELCREINQRRRDLL